MVRGSRLTGRFRLCSLFIIIIIIIIIIYMSIYLFILFVCLFLCQIIFQPVAGGEHGDHLPVAHTCFNLLDLPRYPTKEMMRTKLTQALEYSTGFGLA